MPPASVKTGAFLFLIVFSGRADLTLRYTSQAKVGSSLPPALAEPLKQQLGALIPADRVVRLKGNKTLTGLMGPISAIVDNNTGEITLLNSPAGKYARMSSDEYLATTAGKPSDIAANEAVQKIVAGMKFDVKSSTTGQVGMVAGIRAEESLIEMTVSASLPGVPSGPMIRMEMHLWQANPDELGRIPALREYAQSVQNTMSLFNGTGQMDKLFAQFPGMGNQLRDAANELAKSTGNLNVKTQVRLFMPMLAMVQNRLPAGSATLDATAPIFEMNSDLAEISSAALDDSLFQIPAGFEAAPPADLIRSMTPAQPAAVASNGTGGAAPAVQARLLKRVEPVYPPIARAARVQGPVRFQADIGKDGRIENLQLISGHPLLVQSATEAVKQWIYQPTLLNGEPVRARTVIELNFSLQDAGNDIPPSAEASGSRQPAVASAAGVSQPTLVYKVDPSYTPEALAAKYEGTVRLLIVVDRDGNPRDVQVVRGLGMGLDEKAIEAVTQWRFKPGMKDGTAVNVRATVEVNFRLLHDPALLPDAAPATPR